MANTGATPSTETAAVSWLENNAPHLRIYSSDGHTVTERCWDGSGWTTGAFKQAGVSASATSWLIGTAIHIRVYCTDGSITTEWCWDGGSNAHWYKGAYTS